MTETKSFVDLLHARTQEQRLLMEQIERDGVCPFCPENIERYHTKPITHTRSCIVTRNMAPYGGAQEHWLIIPKRHVCKVSDLSVEEILDIIVIAGELERDLALPGCTIIMRSGDTERTGGSVPHIHTHVIAGGACREHGEALRIKIGYIPLPST